MRAIPTLQPLDSRNSARCPRPVAMAGMSNLRNGTGSVPSGRVGLSVIPRWHISERSSHHFEVANSSPLGDQRVSLVQEAKLRLLIPTQVHHSIGPFRENQFVAVGSVEFGVRCVHRFPRRFFSVEPKDSRGFRLPAEAMHIDLVVTRKSYAGEPVGRV